MGQTLLGQSPAIEGDPEHSSFLSILKIGNNSQISTDLKLLSDGKGNDAPFAVSSTQLNMYGNSMAGSISAGGNFQIFTSSHETKGKFFIGTSGLTYNEATKQLGINTADPEVTLDILGEGRFSAPGTSTDPFNIINITEDGKSSFRIQNDSKIISFDPQIMGYKFAFATSEPSATFEVLADTTFRSSETMTSAFQLFNDAEGGPIMNVDNVTRVISFDSGNIGYKMGILTSDPQATLHIEGTFMTGDPGGGVEPILIGKPTNGIVNPDLTKYIPATFAGVPIKIIIST